VSFVLNDSKTGVGQAPSEVLNTKTLIYYTGA
jgi:hypothetical protein